MPPRQLLIIVAVVAAATLLGVMNLHGQQAQQGGGIQPPRVAVVEVQEVFNNMDEKAAVEAEISQQAQQLNQEDQNRQNEIKALRSDLSVLSPEADAYSQTRTELQRKLIEYQAWKEFSKRQLEREKALRMEALYRKIISAIEQVAQANGYDLVIQKDDERNLSSADNQQQLTALILQRKVLYSDPNLNITDQVIQATNNAYNNRN